MQTSYFKYLVVLFLFITCFYESYAQRKTETLKSLTHLQNIYQKKILLQTDNPVGIYNIEEIAEVSIDYKTDEGRYINYNQPKKVNSIVFSAEGYTMPRKVSFYGKITYNNSREKELKWNNTSFISKNNPFVFADSIASDYDNEIFRLQGKIASSFKNSSLKWGVAIDYKVGNKVDQNDPRPEIESQRIAIKPGVFYLKNKWSFGFNVYYEKLKEEIDVNVVDYKNNYIFFKFLGFGYFFKDSGISFSRNYIGTNYGLSFQSLYENNRLTKSIFEIKYINKYERAEDGSLKTMFLAGDYKNNIFSFYNKWFLNSHNFSNHFLLKINIENIKGIWFDQKKELLEDKTYHWNVYNKSIRSKSLFLDVEIAYTFLKLNYNVGLSIILNVEKSNFYPDNFYKNYYNIKPNISYEKTISSNKNQLHISSNLGIKLNLEKDILVGKLEFLNNIIYPEYYYQTADIVYFNNEFKIGFTNLFKPQLLPYLTFKGGLIHSNIKNNFYTNKIRFNGSVKIGVIF